MIAFWFPGQGSQARGMLDPWMGEPVVRETIEEASDLLGWDVAHIARENPDGKLDRTEFTQPALFAMETALVRLWRAAGGPEPAAAAGHSLGEWSALAAAGVLEFAEGLRLVALRARAMAEAMPSGGRMAAILGLSWEQVAELCARASGAHERVWPANDNCPGQVVVAGHAGAVERLVGLATEAGARRAVVLAVSVPSHTPLMQPAAERMREALARARMERPAFAVWSNVDASPHDAPEDWRALLVRQLVEPVRWRGLVEGMAQQGLAKAVEIGPGKVLAGLARRIARGVSVANPDGPDALARIAEETAREAEHG